MNGEPLVNVTVVPVFIALSYSITASEINGLRNTPLEWVEKMYANEIMWGKQGNEFVKLVRDSWKLTHSTDMADKLETFKVYLRNQNYDPNNLIEAQVESEKVITRRADAFPNLMQRVYFLMDSADGEDRELKLVEKFCFLTSIALAVRDAISDPTQTFGIREYDMLTSAYRAIIGPIHPDDDPLTL
jgi:hypothetical protein